MQPQAYRYDHFERANFSEDVRFTGGPGIRDRFPDFDLPTAFGGRLTRADLSGRPYVMILGSFT